MLAAMGGHRVVLLRGHGITVAATRSSRRRCAVDLRNCVESPSSWPLGADVDVVPERDRAELPDLGSGFNDLLHWQALVAEATT
jgi:hypothetical protein